MVKPYEKMHRAWYAFLLSSEIFSFLLAIVCSYLVYQQKRVFPMNGRQAGLLIAINMTFAIIMLYLMVAINVEGIPCAVEAFAISPIAIIAMLFALRVWLLLFRSHIAAHIANISNRRDSQHKNSYHSSSVSVDIDNKRSSEKITLDITPSGASTPRGTKGSPIPAVDGAAEALLAEARQAANNKLYAWYFQHSHWIRKRYLISFLAIQCAVYYFAFSIMVGVDSDMTKECAHDPYALFLNEGFVAVNCGLCALLALSIKTRKSDGFAIKTEFFRVGFIGVFNTTCLILPHIIDPEWQFRNKWVHFVCVLAAWDVLLLFSNVVPLRASFRVQRAQVQVKYFDYFLTNERARHIWMEFLEQEFATENLYFYMAVENLSEETDLNRALEVATEIYHHHIDQKGDMGVNLPAAVVAHVESCFNSSKDAPDYYQKLFDSLRAAQKEIYDLMKQDSFRRFINTEPFMILTKEFHATPQIELKKLSSHHDASNNSQNSQHSGHATRPDSPAGTIADPKVDILPMGEVLEPGGCVFRAALE